MNTKNLVDELDSLLSIYYPELNIKVDPNLSDEFINSLDKKINWEFISTCSISENFYIKFKSKLNFHLVIGNINCKLSEVFLTKNKNELNKQDWDNISRYKKLSIEFIKENEKFINFSEIMVYNLTEQIIRAFPYKFNISHIIDNSFRHKNISTSFLNMLKIWI